MEPEEKSADDIYVLGERIVFCKILELGCATEALGWVPNKEQSTHGALLGLLIKVILYSHTENEASCYPSIILSQVYGLPFLSLLKVICTTYRMFILRPGIPSNRIISLDRKTLFWLHKCCMLFSLWVLIFSPHFS